MLDYCIHAVRPSSADPSWPHLQPHSRRHGGSMSMLGTTRNASSDMIGTSPPQASVRVLRWDFPYVVDPSRDCRYEGQHGRTKHGCRILDKDSDG